MCIINIDRVLVHCTYYFILVHHNTSLNIGLYRGSQNQSLCNVIDINQHNIIEKNKDVNVKETYLFFNILD